MDTLELADQQQKPSYISSMLNAVKRTFLERWMVGTDDERKLRESLLDLMMMNKEKKVFFNVHFKLKL